MIINQVNITIEAGADFNDLSFTILDEDENVIDLTGATVRSHLREFPESNEYLPFTCEHNGEGGKVTLYMSAEDTAKIGYTKGVYDVFIQYANDAVEKILQGDVYVIPAVTR